MVRALKVPAVGPFLILAAVSWGGSTQAALLQPQGPSERTIETSIGNIPVYSAVQANWTAKKEPRDTLTLTGAGIRVKKVLLFQANVYVIRSYAHLAPTIPVNAENILLSGSRALELNFLRDLSASQIRESFLAAMELNGAPLKDAGVQEFLSFVARDVKEGEGLQILARLGAEDTLMLESGSRKATLNGKDLAGHVWKIWFGKTDDGGLEELKARLCGAKRAS